MPRVSALPKEMSPYCVKVAAEAYGAVLFWQAVGSAPRSYLARPDEIVAHMRLTRSGHGQTFLHEDYTYCSGVGAGHNDAIPVSWRAIKARIDAV